MLVVLTAAFLAVALVAAPVAVLIFVVAPVIHRRGRERFVCRALPKRPAIQPRIYRLSTPGSPFHASAPKPRRRVFGPFRFEPSPS